MARPFFFFACGIRPAPARRPAPRLTRRPAPPAPDPPAAQPRPRPCGAKPLVRGQLSELCAVFYKNNLVYFSLTWGFIFKGYFEPSRRGKSGEKTLHNSSS